MRLRLGLLRDTAAIERQAAKEAASEAAKKKKSSTPTVKTEGDTKAEEEAIAKAAKEKSKSRAQPRIRPLSEAKAIESGANFISEGFLFAVAGGLIVFESWRSRRKETSRREDVASRIGDLEDALKVERRASVELERELLRLREKVEPANPPPKHIIPRQVWQLEQKEEEEDEIRANGWLQRIVSYIQTQDRGSNQTSDKPLMSAEAAQKAASQGQPVVLEIGKERVSVPAGMVQKAMKEIATEGQDKK